MSDNGDARDTAMIPADGSERNHCMSRGQQGNSPAFDASLGPGCRTETWSHTLHSVLYPHLALHLVGVTCLSLVLWKALAVGVLASVFLAGALHYKSCWL